MYIICGVSNQFAWRCVTTPIWPHFPAPTSLLRSNKKRLFLEQSEKTLPGRFCSVLCARVCYSVPPSPSLTQQSYSSILARPPARRGVRTLQHHLHRGAEETERTAVSFWSHTHTFINYQTHVFLPYFSSGKQTRDSVSPSLGVKVAEHRENTHPTCVSGSRKGAVEVFSSTTVTRTPLGIAVLEILAPPLLK